jgi:hypothetical protein
MRIISMASGDNQFHKPPNSGAADMGGDKPAELERIAERNRLIVQMMEIAAKQRHLESMQVGLNLQVNRLQESPSAAVDDLREQLKNVDLQLLRLQAQRDFLAASLAEIDGVVPPPPPASGRA